MNILKKIIKEPLVHFFILGGILFLSFFFLNPDEKNAKEKIIIKKSQIAYLSKRFEIKKKREPTKEELALLIESYIDTEIYYRESLNRQLDKNDDIIKKHLRKKMETIISDDLSFLDVKNKVLQKYMEKNYKKFVIPTMYRFYQVCIDPQKHHLDIKRYLEKVKIDLDSNITYVSESKVLQDYYPQVSRAIVDDIFGEKFHKVLDNAPFGQWVGPIKSQEGYHFIHVVNRVKKRIPDLNKIREYVLNQYIQDKYKEKKVKYLKKLREQYKIIIENGMKK